MAGQGQGQRAPAGAAHLLAAVPWMRLSVKPWQFVGMCSCFSPCHRLEQQYGLKL